MVLDKWKKKESGGQLRLYANEARCNGTELKKKKENVKNCLEVYMYFRNAIDYNKLLNEVLYIICIMSWKFKNLRY